MTILVLSTDKNAKARLGRANWVSNALIASSRNSALIYLLPSMGAPVETIIVDLDTTGDDDTEWILDHVSETHKDVSVVGFSTKSFISASRFLKSVLSGPISDAALKLASSLEKRSERDEVY